MEEDWLGNLISDFSVVDHTASLAAQVAVCRILSTLSGPTCPAFRLSRARWQTLAPRRDGAKSLHTWRSYLPCASPSAKVL